MRTMDKVGKGEFPFYPVGTAMPANDTTKTRLEMVKRWKGISHVTINWSMTGSVEPSIELLWKHCYKESGLFSYTPNELHNPGETVSEYVVRLTVVA